MKIEVDLLSVIIGFVVGTAPFWLMASDLTDQSELKSSGIGIMALVVVKLLEFLTSKKEGE